MKIVSLEAEHVKVLKAIRIDANGNPLIEVSGKNGVGKTTVLDCITMALGGKRAIPSEPITKGESKAKIVVDLGDLVVKRTFTKKGSALVVKAKDGRELTSPQAVLEKLIGMLTFDPLEFSRMDRAEQSKVLRQLLGLDFYEQDETRKEIFAKRTEINRDLKAARVQLSDLPEPDPDTPSEEIDTAKLTRELAELNLRNKKRGDAEYEKGEYENELKATEAEIWEHQEKIRKLREKLPGIREKLEQAQTELENLGPVEDPEPLTCGLSEAGAANRAIFNAMADKKKRAELKSRISEREFIGEEYTRKIEKIDNAKRKALEQAAYPVDGLGLSEDGVTFGGLPFDQASSAEQLRVSVAIGIAMNPDLKVLLIRDASLLDADNLKMVATMAKEAEAQVWIERVGDSDNLEVRIEDGEGE